jgi:hypothetical protein
MSSPERHQIRRAVRECLPRGPVWGLPDAGRLATLVCLGLLALGGSSATALSLSGVSPRMRKIAELEQAGVPNPTVRAEGLDPGSATLAFTSPVGVEVRVVSNATVSCIMLSPGGENCAGAAAVAAQGNLVIQSECGPQGKTGMMMFGLAPSNATAVRVPYTSGPGLNGGVTDGAFLIESVNPDRGGPFPTKIQYLNAEGRVLVSQDIAGGEDLCMWRETGGPVVSTTGNASKHKPHHPRHHAKRTRHAEGSRHAKR